jgi:PAS domain S-box-containing protein
MPGTHALDDGSLPASPPADDAYRTLFMGAPEAYLVTTVEGVVVDLNAQAARLYRSERASIVGRHVTDLTDIDRAEYARRDATLQRDGEASFIGIGRRVDGAPFAEQIAIRRVILDGVPRDLVRIRDTTEPDRLQAELLQAQKMEALSQIVGGAAHELNNPLQAIIGFSRLLSADPALPAELRSDAGLLVVEATRTRRIVENLLDFARQRPPERHPTRLALLVQSVLDLQAYHFSGPIGVEVAFADDLPPVPLDRAMMQQVILNLTQNAIQAIESAGGHGTIRITGSADRDATGAAVARLTVADDGPGVAEEHRDRLFVPFFTTKPQGQGTGLGLSVSFGIVAGHGGRLWFQPGADHGSVFTIELPLEASSADGQLSAVAAASPGGPGDETGADGAEADPPSGTAGERRVRVLVVDDVESIRTFLVRVLSRVVDVVAAGTGTEALGLVEHDDFDGILCDHRMPGLTGIEVFEAIAALRPALARHFVLMSGDVLNPQLLAFAEDRGVRLLAKPVDVETLQAVVAEMTSAIAEAG